MCSYSGSTSVTQLTCDHEKVKVKIYSVPYYVTFRHLFRSPWILSMFVLVSTFTYFFTTIRFSVAFPSMTTSRSSSDYFNVYYPYFGESKWISCGLCLGSDKGIPLLLWWMQVVNNWSQYDIGNEEGTLSCIHAGRIYARAQRNVTKFLLRGRRMREVENNTWFASPACIARSHVRLCRGGWYTSKAPDLFRFGVRFCISAEAINAVTVVIATFPFYT
jgi:hypothetical protein